MRRLLSIAAVGAVSGLLAGCDAPPAAKAPATAAPAAPASVQATTAGPAANQDTVGTNTTVQNAVTTHGLGETAWRPSVVEGPVRFMDDIVTGDASRLDVTLRDRSALSLGPNAKLTIDKFVYDPAPGAAGVGVKVVTGVFRFASKVHGSDGVSFQTPTAAIGVRGTVLEGAVGPVALKIVGDWAGGLHLAEDPATAAVIVLREGVIEVRTEARTVTLRVPGQAVAVLGRKISDPFVLKASASRRILIELPLAPPPDGFGRAKGGSGLPRTVEVAPPPRLVTTPPVIQSPAGAHPGPFHPDLTPGYPRISGPQGHPTTDGPSPKDQPQGQPPATNIHPGRLTPGVTTKPQPSGVRPPASTPVTGQTAGPAKAATTGKGAGSTVGQTPAGQLTVTGRRPDLTTATGAKPPQAGPQIPTKAPTPTQPKPKPDPKKKPKITFTLIPR